MGEAPAGRRRWTGRVLTALAVVVVWVALLLPRDLGALPEALVRLPVEGLVLLAAAALLPWRVTRPVALLGGLALGALLLLRVLDLGFGAVLDRPFAPVTDWGYLGPGLGVLEDSVGRGWALATAVLAGVLTLAVLVLLPLAVLRVCRAAAAHRRTSLRAAGALAVVWALGATLGLQAVPGTRLASGSTAMLAYDEVAQVRADLRDRRRLAREIAQDDFASVPGDRLLTALRGKDVLLVFVESYGRVALEDPAISPDVVTTLDEGTRSLAAAGFGARSAFLTSPTFGAASWLAHATAQSGVWVDSQGRYDQLLDTDRLTLTRAFDRAGWRTVVDVPANTEDWPEGASFYGADRLFDSRDVGYRGPRHSYAPMPDQYTLDAFRRRELDPAPRRPVMAEIDLVSSHHPWTPRPRMVAWDRVGDGSVWDETPTDGGSPEEVFRDPDAVRAAYGASIVYSWRALTSFVAEQADPDLVLVVLGDHQPHSYVTGPDPGHDVPVSLIAHDPAVLDRIDDWRWQDGLRPSPDAPVWRMDGLRDRLLTAFGPG